MSGVISAVSDAIGFTSFGEQKAKAQAMEREANQRAEDQNRMMQQQQKALDSQKKAEEQNLNAKKKRMLSASAGTSGLINTSPQGQSSVLG